MNPQAAELLSRLIRNDVQLYAEGGMLHYDAPEAVPTDELLAQMKVHKAELLAWLADTDPHRIVWRRCLPGYNQQEIWQKDQLAGKPVVYTVAQRWTLHGRLDVTALKDAINRWSAGHATLRTRFSSIPDRFEPGNTADQPVLELVEPWRQPLAVTVIPGETASDQQKNLDHAVAQVVNEPIPLNEAPLWRLRLFRLATHEHVLVWILHHAICDGTSMSRLAAELVDTYESLRKGEEPQPAATTPDQLDYALSQRKELSGDRMTGLTDFWKRRLSGASLALNFDYDRPHPGRLSGAGDILKFGLSSDDLTALRTTAKRMNTTLYIVMLSAYAMMLSEFTGQPDVVLPISQARRTDPRHAAVIGMVADRVPIRISVGTSADLADLIGQVGDRVFEAMDHQDLPLSLLLTDLPESQRPANSYPTALFTLLDGFETTPDAQELTIDIAPEAPVGTARMEFYCFMTSDHAGLQGWLEYSTDLFDAATVQRWIDRFIEILHEMSGHPAEVA